MYMMNKGVLSSLSLAALLSAATPAIAQQLDLPRPSPNAKVTQTIGLTDVTVDYSCPGVKGRTIWGAVVPYDKIWRSGANGLTKITFSKDVLVGGKPVPAGTYGLFTLPGKAAFTVILTRNLTQANTGSEYKEADDAVRFTANVQTIAPRERLQYVFSDMTDAGGSLDLEWEKLKISIPISVKTDEQALANIKTVTDGAWRPFANSARYMFEVKKDNDAALRLVDQSLSLKEDWYNVWIKAQVLNAKGAKEAYAMAEKTKALGDKAPAGSYFFADDVTKALAEWKKDTGKDARKKK